MRTPTCDEMKDKDKSIDSIQWKTASLFFFIVWSWPVARGEAGGGAGHCPPSPQMAEGGGADWEPRGGAKGGCWRGSQKKRSPYFWRPLSAPPPLPPKRKALSAIFCTLFSNRILHSLLDKPDGLLWKCTQSNREEKYLSRISFLLIHRQKEKGGGCIPFRYPVSCPFLAASH